MMSETNNATSLGRESTIEGSRDGTLVGGGERPVGPTTSTGPEARENEKVRQLSTEDLNQQDTSADTSSKDSLGETGTVNRDRYDEFSFYDSEANITNESNLSKANKSFLSNDSFDSFNPNFEDPNFTNPELDNPNLADITLVNRPYLDNVKPFVKEKTRKFKTSDRRYNKKLRREAMEAKDAREASKKASTFGKEVDKEYLKKPSFAECVKSTVMLEIRSTDLGVELEQCDFDELDGKLLEIKALEYSGPAFDYGIFGGIGNNAIWIACSNQATADFVKLTAPTIKPPEYSGWTYQVFDNEHKPYRYMKLRVHKKFWNNSTNLKKFIDVCNPFLTTPIAVDDEGEAVMPHFVIMAGCCENKEEEIKDNYFWIDIEIGEKLFSNLIALKGQIKLGASFVKLIGGGMVYAAKKKIKDNLNSIVDNAANNE